MTAAEVLAAWQNTADAATEGPWSRESVIEDDITTWAVLAGDHGQTVCDVIGPDDPTAEVDAEFIALLRDALPRAVAALQAVLAEHRPGNVYLLTDECGHDHDDDSDDRVGRDDWGDAFCLDSPTGETFCTSCIGSDESNLPYPCATVRAINAALGVEP